MAESLNTATVSGVKLIERDDMVVRAHRTRRLGFEPSSLECWRVLSRCNGTMVDVGCYTGIYAIAAAQAGVRVVAFDPNPHAIGRAIENAAANGVTIEFHETALWSCSEPLKLYGARPLTSASSMTPKPTKFRAVMGTTLDSYGLTNVRAIKIDAERSEPQVLAGAMQTIKRDRPDLLIEVLDGQAEIHGILNPLGYRGEWLDDQMMLWGAK